MFVDDFRVEPNTAPLLSTIANRVIAKSSTTGTIPFFVDDLQTGSAAVALSATSSNVALVPNGSVVLGGSGTSRTISITPLVGQTGITTITLNASDSWLASTTSFTVTVLTDMESWRQYYFGTTANRGDAANLADIDADGFENVLEYSLGLNPLLPDAGSAPAAVNEGGYLTMTISKRPGVI